MSDFVRLFLGTILCGFATSLISFVVYRVFLKRPAPTKKAFYLGFLLFFALLQIPSVRSCFTSNEAHWHQFSGRTMGTTWHITLNALNFKEDFLQSEIEAALKEVESHFSTFDTESEISRFNQSGTNAFEISPMFLKVFEAAQRIFEKTGGAFDPTVGPLVEAYGFGKAERKGAPSPEMIEEIKSHVGFNHISLDRKNQTLTKDHEAVTCTFAAIAKGFGVDQIFERIQALGIQGAMIEVGGEVRVLGKNHEQKPWKIGIRHPGQPGQTIAAVPLSHGALATSGDYFNMYTDRGERLNHTFDPRTGENVRHNLTSVSVFSETTLEADALATALMVLGPEEGFNFAESNGIPAYFILRSGSDFKKKSTTAFHAIENGLSEVLK